MNKFYQFNKANLNDCFLGNTNDNYCMDCESHEVKKMKFVSACTIRQMCIYFRAGPQPGTHDNNKETRQRMRERSCTIHGEQRI